MIVRHHAVSSCVAINAVRSHIIATVDSKSVIALRVLERVFYSQMPGVLIAVRPRPPSKTICCGYPRRGRERRPSACERSCASSARCVVTLCLTTQRLPRISTVAARRQDVERIVTEIVLERWAPAQPQQERADEDDR